MNTHEPPVIRGYSATGRAFRCPIINAKSRKAHANTVVPVSYLSEPILDMLAGRLNLETAKTIIADKAGDSGHDNKDAPKIALIIPDMSNPRECFAVEYPITQNVVAAIKLSGEDERWVAEACVIHAEELVSYVSLCFCSSAVTALLNMSAKAFVKVLKKPTKACGCLNYLCENGDMFQPHQPDKRKWTIACRWPEWKKQRLTFAGMSYALRVVGGGPEVDAGNFRQICRRMGLLKSDNSDSASVTELRQKNLSVVAASRQESGNSLA